MKHWRVMQSLKKKQIVVSNMTWRIWWVFTQPLESLKIYFRWALNTRNYKLIGVIFHDTEQWCNVWINPDLVVSKAAWGWWWWWWWIVFVVWLTDERRLALFSAGTIARDPHHRESPARREHGLNQNLSSGLVEWSCAVVITTTPRRLGIEWTLDQSKIWKTVLWCAPFVQSI